MADENMTDEHRQLIEKMSTGGYTIEDIKRSEELFREQDKRD